MFEFVLAQLRANDVLSGLVGGSLFASVLFMLRKIPGMVWDWICWRLTCVLVVQSEDEAFERMNEWLSAQDYTARCRNLVLRTNSENADRLVPGFGWHVVWYKGWPLRVTRAQPNDRLPPGQSSRRPEDIIVRKLGGSSKLLHELVDELTAKSAAERATHVDVYTCRYDGWSKLGKQAKRSLASVVMNRAQRDRIVRDAERFVKAKKEYAERGVPYRRGFLFEGPPGCGKTTMAIALASHLGRPIYVVNLGSISDELLTFLMATVPEHGIVLMEDIDAADLEQRGEPVRVERPRHPQKATLTLSGLLNALDGLFASEGRILVMTTNHPDKVDEALIRPGRADRREHFGEIEAPEILEMCKRFGRPEFARGVITPIRPAVLQEMLLREPDETPAQAAE